MLWSVHKIDQFLLCLPSPIILGMSKHNRFKTNDKQDKSADRQQIKVPVYLTAALFLIMGIYAISITMIGPIMPSVIEDYQIRLSQGGLMTTAQSIGGTTSSMIFLSGAFATMIFPWLVGRIAESSGFQMALQLTWITLFVLFAAGLVLSRSLKSNIEG